MSTLMKNPTSRDPLTQILKDESKAIVLQAIKSLPIECSEVIIRYYIKEEGTQIEVAMAMGLTVATFNNRLAKGRKLMREYLNIA